MPKIILIAAMADKRVIGVQNKLPWKLSVDLKRFRSFTLDHCIIMGRLTFESLGRPLKNRKHIVLTRGNCPPPLVLDDGKTSVTFCPSIERALEICAEEVKIYIIGGDQIYRHALPIADHISLTRVYGAYDGDAFFPNFEDEFKLENAAHGCDEGIFYAFQEYSRKNK